MEEQLGEENHHQNVINNVDDVDMEDDVAAAAGGDAGFFGGNAELGPGLQQGDLAPGRDNILGEASYNLLMNTANPDERSRMLGFTRDPVGVSDITMVMKKGKPGPKVLRKLQAAKVSLQAILGDKEQLEVTSLLDLFMYGTQLKNLVEKRVGLGFYYDEALSYLVRVCDFRTTRLVLRSAPNNVKASFEAGLPVVTGSLHEQLESFLEPRTSSAFIVSLIELCAQVDRQLAKLIRAECAKHSASWAISVKAYEKKVRETVAPVDPNIWFPSILCKLEMLVAKLVGSADLDDMAESNAETVKAFFSLLGAEVKAAFITFLRTDEAAADAGFNDLVVAVGNNDPTNRDVDYRARLETYTEAFSTFLSNQGWSKVTSGSTSAVKPHVLSAVRESERHVEASTAVARLLAIRDPKVSFAKFNQLRKEHLEEVKEEIGVAPSAKEKFPCAWFKTCFDLAHGRECSHSVAKNGPKRGMAGKAKGKGEGKSKNKGQVQAKHVQQRKQTRVTLQSSVAAIQKVDKARQDILMASLGYAPKGAASSRPEDEAENAEARGISAGARLRPDGAYSIAQGIAAIVDGSGKKRKRQHQ